jgi:hypothetical protein
MMLHTFLCAVFVEVFLSRLWHMMNAKSFCFSVFLIAGKLQMLHGFVSTVILHNSFNVNFSLVYAGA